MTLSQAGFIELLRGTLAVRPDGTSATGRKRSVPRVETLRLLLAEHTWHRDHGVRTRVALVLAPTLDGMRYAGLENVLESVSYTHLDVYKRQSLLSLICLL